MAVFLGRFVAFFRAVMPALAGSAPMPYRTFLAYNPAFTGDYGPCLTPRDSGCTPLLSGTNLLIDGAVIHGQTLDPSSGEHVDGLFVRGCSQCTIRRTKFIG